MTKSNPTLAYLSGFTFLAIVGLSIYFLFTLFHYTDLQNGCIIKTNSTTFGSSTKGIRAALEFLSQTDAQSYQLVCENVDTITEKPCITRDPLIPTTDTDDVVQKSCYIRGSKTIYLAHSEVTNEKEMKEQVRLIKKAANRAWQYNHGQLP